MEEWLPVKQIVTKNTYLNMVILPYNTTKFTGIIKYAMSCLQAAPFTRLSQTALYSALEEIANQNFLYPENNYPVLVTASSVMCVCEKYGVSYDELKKWLLARGIIASTAGRAERHPETRKTTKFLIFQKALSEYITDLDTDTDNVTFTLTPTLTPARE